MPATGDTARSGFLHDRLIALAGTPDDSPRIGADLIVIAQLAAVRIAAVEFASITSRYEGAYTTVAASNDLAVAVDQAQYVDDAGPCLDALTGGEPTAVPDIAATVAWPAFRDFASRLGLTTSLSIPLFAGSGRTVAALNLYGRDPSAMKSLTTAVWAAYDPETPPSPLAGLESGARELITGLISAFAARDLIQQAVGILLATTGAAPDDAYLTLCAQAAGQRTSLTDTASRLIASHQRWP